MASSDQKLRTLRLMEILLECTDDTHMLNASELCAILDQEYGMMDKGTIRIPYGKVNIELIKRIAVWC